MEIVWFTEGSATVRQLKTLGLNNPRWRCKPDAAFVNRGRRNINKPGCCHTLDLKQITAEGFNKFSWKDSGDTVIMGDMTLSLNKQKPKHHSWWLFGGILLILISEKTKTFANTSHETQIKSDPRYMQGKEQYEVFQRYSKMPKYSACWTDALKELEAGCRSLSDDMQHKLALAFTNCFLAKTGRKTYPCDVEQSVAECTEDMAPEAYNTYTEFFTHTQNICFFLQGQVWQEGMDQTVNKLSHTSAQVAEQLQDSTLLQSQIIEKQNKSLENQEKLITKGHELKHTLESSSTNIKNILQDFKDTTAEQRAMIFEVFDRVNSLQSMVVGEVTGFYSLILHVLAVIVSYLVTSTPRSNGARFWLFAIVGINYLGEWLLSQWHNSGETTMVDNPLWYRQLRVWRVISGAMALIVLIVKSYCYEDINECNNRLLREIKLELNRIQEKGLPDQSLMSAGAEETDSGGLANGLCLTPSEDVQTTGDLGDSESESGDSFSSYDSGVSDHSFMPAPHESSDSDESFTTAGSKSNRTSREGTPAVLKELELLRETSPLRESTPVAGAGDVFQRPPIRRGRRSRAISPDVVIQTPGGHRYNLRQRAKVAKENPIVLAESPREFAKNLAKMAALNRYMTRSKLDQSKEVPENRGVLFSSDDDES